MFEVDEHQKLEKAFEPTHAPDPAHKRELGETLAAAFEAQPKELRRVPLKKSHVLRKVIFGAAIAAAIGLAACAAPVDVNVDVGKSISVTYQASADAPEPPKVVDTIEHAAKFEDVQVRIRRENDTIVVQAEVWGENAADVSITDSLKKTFPALSTATITEKPLSGKVESTLGKKLAHEFFDTNLANEKDLEVVRQKIIADLAAQGVQGEVDVKVEGQSDGKKKVMIQIKQEGPDCEPEPDQKTHP